MITIILINLQINMQPGYMQDFATQLYFVVFIILGAFFILNLFIGVIIDNFNRLKQQYEDGIGIFLTSGQRNWINTLKSAAEKKPTRRLTRPTVKLIFLSLLLLNIVLFVSSHNSNITYLNMNLLFLKSNISVSLFIYFNI